MGISIPPNLRIAGYRPSMFKSALRAFERTHSPENFVDLQSVFGDRRTGAIAFEECLERGLIAEEDGGFGLTEAGIAIAKSKVTKRAPLKKALAIVEEFLDRVEAFNADPEPVQFVDQVWLFGSVMRREETVGDIDIAIEKSRRPQWQEDFEGMLHHLDEVMDRRPDAPLNLRFPWGGDGWLLERGLFGPRRHPLLAGVQFGTSDLVEIGAPCRLLFDRQRGGRVTDPIVKRHPRSSGRSENASAPETMPDLRPTTLRPVDGRWLAGHVPSGNVSPYRIFGSWSDDAHALFPRPPLNLKVLAHGDERDWLEWAPKQMRNPLIDGRNSVMVANTQFGRGVSVVLHRRIATEPDGFAIRATLDGAEKRFVKTQFLEMLEDVSSAIALMLATDAERACRRAEEGSVHRVAIEVSKATGTDPVLNQLQPMVIEKLQGRRAKVEPEGWPGPDVNVCLAAPPSQA